MSTTPLVSICCQTYNHIDYIAETLDSFLMQKTDFEFEILLRDDASTDGTTEICHRYANKYPNKIKLLAYTENQWQRGISPFRDNVKRAQGKYIAMCEGDDYWTDSDKLQIQVDLIEKHNVGISFHAAEILSYNKDKINSDKSTFFYGDDIKVLSVTDIIDANGKTLNTPLASFVLKKEILDQLKSKDLEFYSNNLQHSFIILWMTYCSKALYVPRFMSVYRKSHVESWTYKMKSDFTFKKDYSLKTIKSYTKFDKITEFEFSSKIKKSIDKRIFSILKNINIPLKERNEFFKELKDQVNFKNRVLWFFIFKRKNVLQFINWLFKSYRQL